MARTVQATWPAPDPLQAVAGLRILAGNAPTEPGHIDDLVLGINHVWASNTPVVVSQGWPELAYTETAGALTKRAEWRIPQLDADGTHTDVRCWVRASGDGTAASAVRFRAVGAGNNLDITNILAAGYWTGVNLTCAFAGGFETIELWSSTGVGPPATIIQTAGVEYMVLGNPLAAAAPGDAFIPMDDAESVADEALSPRLLRRASDNLTTIETFPRVYVNISGLTGINKLPGPIAMDTLFSPQSLGWTVPILPGTIARDYTMTVWVLGGHAVNNTDVVIQHGPGDVKNIADDNGHQTTLNFPGGGGNPVWRSTTIRPDDTEQIVPGAPQPFAHLGIYIDEAGSVRAPWGPGSTDCPIYSLAIWGR